MGHPLQVAAKHSFTFRCSGGDFCPINENPRPSQPKARTGHPDYLTHVLREALNDLSSLAFYAVFSFQNFISSAEGPYMPGSSISLRRR
jgi:hypothetical protein